MVKKIGLIVLSIFICGSIIQAQGVAIGGTTPHISAMLEVRSINKGLLLPRLTTTQRTSIPSPTAGLQIFNTTSNAFEFYNGTTWQTLTTSPWIPHTNGIYFSSGNVGIGTIPSSNISLTVQSSSESVANAAMFTSNGSWHTAVALKNNSAQYTFIVAGPSDTELLPQSFGLYNGLLGRWSLTVSPNDNFIGIGGTSAIASRPKSRLHIFDGDVNIENIASGIIMKSPNGNCWRVTIDNTGNLIRTQITCL